MNLPDLSKLNKDDWETTRARVVVEALGYQGALIQRRLHPEQAEMVDTLVAMAEENLDKAIAMYVQRRQAEFDAMERGG